MKNKYQIGDIIKGKVSQNIYEVTYVMTTIDGKYCYNLKPIKGTVLYKHDVPEKDIDEHGELDNSYPNTGLSNNSIVWNTGHTITLPTAYNNGKTFNIKNGNSTQTCSCDLKLLMQSGCQCGAIERYKPTYK